MLGRLARWLRMMGYDTLYVREGVDSDIAKLSKDQKRTILTRDRELAGRRGVSSFYIPEILLERQLALVSKRFGLRFSEETMRCSECNGPLAMKEKRLVKGQVPDGVYEKNSIFYACGGCGKLYWKGTHWSRISQLIDKVTTEDRPAEGQRGERF